MTEGVDYSYARPGGARLAAEGKVFAVRYLSNDGRGIGNEEIADLRAHGREIVLVKERSSSSSLKGFAEGADQAREAQAQLEQLDLPHDLPIYFTADRDTSAGDLPAVLDFIHGAASILGADRTGIYGEHDVIIAAQAAQVCRWFWQTYAWSGGKVAANIHLLQYSNDEWGGAVDFTRAYMDEYGQHGVAEDDWATFRGEEEDVYG